ncbi:XK-related protein 9 [Spea bombifrons]|uniref:XK-related protein 9 n=1 Tax=Spea bombifrons TaxID=233779 RepID=UPI0023491D09|nr:XK-related protein 9 [Spea bombifrons]
MSFTKWNFLMTVFGIFTFLFDIGADIWIAIKYFQQGHHLFSFLTVFFILVSTTIVQVFSYTWFKDDCEDKGKRRLRWILLVHIFLSGIFLRYWYSLKYGYQATLSEAKQQNPSDTKKKAVDAMTDMSMLRCFKTYLESAPQLILQLFILLEHGQISVIQYASILVSVSSISWSTVDYQMSLRKSLPGKKAISVGLPAITFVLYKLFTLTSWILSIVFLLACNPYIFIIVIIILGLAGFCWIWKQHTDFCTTKSMEVLYRIVVGSILIFTFFNVKGQRTRVAVSVYYFVRVLTTIGILILCFSIKPHFTQTFLFAILSVSVVFTLGLGIISLILYYVCFHPTLCSKDQDRIDGPTAELAGRIRSFIIL